VGLLMRTVTSIPDTTGPAPVYDRIAAHYDSAIVPLERWFLRGLRARALAHLPPAGLVLEIGAGTGLNLAHYPACAGIVATDISCAMLELAKQKASTNQVTLLACKAEALPFADAQFDALVGTLVLCSVDDLFSALTEARRVVKPGGTIILLEHVRPENPLLGVLFDLLSKLTVRLFADHFNRRTAEKAAQAGLRISYIEKKYFGIINLIVCHEVEATNALDGQK
jgi:ubiquinone/menaquinone biosynthesis C-methylase UbiE